MAVIFWYYKTKKVIVVIKPVPWVYRNVTSSFVAISSIFIPRFTWSPKSNLSQPKVDSVILSLQSVNYKFSLIFPSPKLACKFESAYSRWDGDRCLGICTHTHAEMYLTTSPWLSSSLHVDLHWDLCIHIGPCPQGFPLWEPLVKTEKPLLVFWFLFSLHYILHIYSLAHLEEADRGKLGCSPSHSGAPGSMWFTVSGPFFFDLLCGSLSLQLLLDTSEV